MRELRGTTWCSGISYSILDHHSVTFSEGYPCCDDRCCNPGYYCCAIGNGCKSFNRSKPPIALLYISHPVIDILPSSCGGNATGIFCRLRVKLQIVRLIGQLSIPSASREKASAARCFWHIVYGTK
ncbi:hypothetical protein SCLCIDRAFT_1223070 [Scleroderma citrinum Foug A]|uniref:Uncharacterized protein n=1 Tax=Scleroderma citrinum Foug A TaxID=1036808 RepID=A0A0C2ZKJ5_9AGAM|nr:hypothetical protein SCLCIDRAFT_1223070 [Scleroderma citrinum Foug A]